MVALHNRRLTQRDLWPDLLWRDEEFLALQRRFRTDLEAQGLSGAELHFEVVRATEEWHRQWPTYAQRQRIVAGLYPPPPAPLSVPFTEEERLYLLELLEGRNHPLAAQIAAKLGLPSDTSMSDRA